MIQKESKNKTLNVRAENADKFNIAFRLYRDHVPQKQIAERLNVSERTLSEWKRAGNWDILRASREVSVDSIIIKTLQKIDELLESDNFNADAFCKSVKQLSTLKGANTVNDIISSFNKFHDWLDSQQPQFPDRLSPQFIKELIFWHDKFIDFMIKISKS
jgi:transcriptional regulator with XRE-family HTH domain